MRAVATSTLEASSSTGPKLENVLYEKRNGIAYVTINRPKALNVLNAPTWKDLRAAFEDVRDDVAVHGAILTGAGDEAFIAGADIAEPATLASSGAAQVGSFGQDVLDLVENLGKPVIAAVNGFALGDGCEAAMACTFRVAVERASFGHIDALEALRIGLVDEIVPAADLIPRAEAVLQQIASNAPIAVDAALSSKRVA